MTAAPAETEIPARVLVLGMAHHDGTILAAEVEPVAAACGQPSEAVQDALAGLVDDGLFTEATAGRYEPTETGRAELAAMVERTRLAYAQDAEGRGWDRMWHLVALSDAGRALERRLEVLGGARVQPGLWVSPHPWEADVRAEAERLGVGDRVTTATTDDLEIGGQRDPRAIAAQLWAIDELAERYTAFVNRYEDVPDALAEMRHRKERLTEAEFLAGALTTVLDYQECFERDPLLPPELLPRPWPGRQARDLLARGRRLGVLARQEHVRPALFQVLDEVLDRL